MTPLGWLGRKTSTQTNKLICPAITCSSLFLLSVPQERLCFVIVHYENTPIQIYWKFHHQKLNFSGKNSEIFHIATQNIDCGYLLEPRWRGGSNEYQQFMFWSRNKKNNVYPCKLQFYYIKVGFKGVKIILACFHFVFFRYLEKSCASWLSPFFNACHPFII